MNTALETLDDGTIDYGLVTAAFQHTIDYTDGDEDAATYYKHILYKGANDTEGSVDWFFHLAMSAGLESIADHIVRTVPELRPYVEARDSRPMGIDYDTYHTLMYEKIKEMGSLVGVQKHDKTKKWRIKFPMIELSSRQVKAFWQEGSNFTIGDETLNTYSAFDIAALRWAGNKPGSFIEEIPFSEAILQDLYESDRGKSEQALDEWMDEAIFSFYTRMIKGFEVRGAYMAPTEYNEELKKNVPIQEEEGITNKNVFRIHEVPMMLYVVVELPATLAQWMTQQEDSDPRVVYEWFREYYNGFMSSRSPYPPDAIKTLDQVVEETVGVREVKLTDDRDLCVTFNGEIMYVPEIKNLDAYNAYVQNLNRYRNEKGSVIEFDPYRYQIENMDNQVKSETNAPIYTDWRLNKFTYINTAGGVSITDLNGARPATVSADLKILDVPVSYANANAALSDIIPILKTLGIDWLTLLKPADFVQLLPVAKREAFLSIEDKDEAFKELYLQLGSVGVHSWPYNAKELVPLRLVREVRFALWNANRRTVDYDTENSEFDYSSVEATASMGDILSWPGLQAIKYAMDAIHKAKKYDEIAGRIGVDRATRTVPYYAVIASHNSREDVLNADRELRTQYREAKTNPAHTPAPVPNIGTNVNLLPHQVKADSMIVQDPDLMIDAVQPGGGKTFLGMIDGARGLAKGERVAFIMPNHLVRNYLEDGQYMFQGKMNFICVDNNVYGRWGEDRLRTLITQAPPNTFVMFGLSVFSMGKNITYSYNGKVMTINQIAEFFRSLGFDRVIIDEGHLLANSETNRSLSVSRGLSGVNKIRDMTGTFINGTVADALGQTRLMNPLALGTDDDFNGKYAAEMSGNKVTRWHPNAERNIGNEIKSEIAYLSIRRKEWAALLPNRQEEFHFVDLSPAQMDAYMSILTQIMREMEIEAPDLVKKLKAGDEEDAVGTEGLLRRFLQRVERFLAAPDLDELGKRVLHGADLVSPKITKINELLAEHFANPNRAPGKVLIFTNYKDSAESIFSHLAPEFKSMAMHYTAEMKDELIPLMKKDDRFQIVVGVRESLKEGQNFQMFSRMIRVETVWNPGTLDQEEARLNRPDPKNQSAERSDIWVDWICANNTIDVTKTARLISKLLSATKFEEQDTNFYDDLPNLKIVSMNFDNIMVNNDFRDTLVDYLDAYKLFQQAQMRDFEEYKKNTPYKAALPLPSAGIMKGSALIDVPYVPGMVLPFQNELGLQNLGDYAMDRRLSVAALTIKELSGKRVHTEYGDGKVVGSSQSAIRVELKSGEKVSVEKLAAFLIPPKFTGEVRKAINDRIELKTVKPKPLTRTEKDIIGVTPEKTIDVKPTKNGPKEKKPVPNTDTEMNKEVQVFLSVINNTLSVSLSPDDPDLDPKIIKKAGLQYVEPYVYAYIKTAKHLEAVLDRIQSKFKVPASQIAVLEAISEAFSQGKQKLFQVDQADISTLKHFLLEGRKSQKPDVLFLYPHIEEGLFYLCAWADQPAAKRLPALTSVPGVRFYREEGFYAQFFRKKTEAKAFIQSISSYGLKVSNLADVKAAYTKIVLK